MEMRRTESRIEGLFIILRTGVSGGVVVGRTTK
jgi:hypothetical protein